MPWVNDGGVWKQATPYANDNGVWKLVTEVWVNDNGVWKKAGGSVTVSLSPASQAYSGTLMSRTFSATTVSVTGGTPTAYNWGHANPYGGTWSVSNGQGTNSATSRVNWVANYDTATADFYCDVTVNGQVYRAVAYHSYERLGGGG